ncbi:MAG: serine protease [Hyphomicrobiaceae bacterium]|nr:serine protease [Hyphomicrobiaceae bacterium]
MSAPTDNNFLTALSGRLERLAQTAGSAVVGVRSQGRHVASGFIWRPGTVVTAASAVESDEELSVSLASDRNLAAQLAGRDPATGIAVLSVREALPDVAALTASSQERVGQLVLALGRGDPGLIAALGVVSAVGGAWQSQRGGSLDRLVLLDIGLRERCKGGIVIDGDGALIGMALLGGARGPLVIPAPTIERVAPRLLADGRIFRGYLGVGLHPIRLDDALAAVHALEDRRATMVVSVDPDGPARKGGILVGDIIVAFNGEPVPGMRSLLGKLTPESVGTTAELRLLRAGQIATAKVAIARRPAS